jgi:pyruvate formate lyase activating enzyme
MASVSGIIFDIKKYSIHDGPGIRTTIFFKGCPLRCWWCHNPESQSPKLELMLRGQRCIRCGACAEVCTEEAIGVDAVNGSMPVINRQQCQVCGKCVEACYSGARELVGRRVDASELMAEVERDQPFYDQSGGGVTFSGGEPLMQPVFLMAFLQACRESELHTVLDTSGYAHWKTVEKTLPLVDVYLYDLKLASEARHKVYTGVSNRLILQNLYRLSEAGANVVVRVPLIPGVNDDKANLCKAGEVLSSLPKLPQVEIIAYHDIAGAKYESLGRDYRLPGVKTPTPETLAWAVQTLASYGLQTSSLSLTQALINGDIA